MKVLSTLITKEPQRKRGAGSKLVEWGVQQAKNQNVPAYLEATPSGAPVYEKVGFRKVGERQIDLEEFGFPQPVVLALMAANQE